MEVNFNTVNLQNNNQYSKNIYPCPSFKMKMNELHGIDRYVARKYKINPQPIKTLKDFQEKCKEIVEKFSVKDFSGRQKETQVQRKAMINDWHDYVTKENGVYTGAMALMILGGITAGLKPKEDTLPPVLNKEVLANTVDEINRTIPENPEDNAISFDKKYRLNLQKSIMGEEKALDESLNGWIVIPSKEHDPEHFEANVDKLKMLSHDNWCTKSFNVRPYLEKGDFHVYMEQGKPQLGVRFVGDEIEEIQGELNNSKIPVKYGDITKEHIKNYKLTNRAKGELEKLEKTRAELEKIKIKFPNGINNAPTKEVLEALGIKCERDSDGLLTISNYGDAELGYTYSDLGIDEDRLFKDIKAITGNVNFTNSQVTDLGNLQTIGGYADFSHSQITNLGNLQTIGGYADFLRSQITSLGNLKSIGGFANFYYSQITNLGKLVSIGGDAGFCDSRITDLGNLESIGGDALFNDSQITSLGNLKSIGRDVMIYASNLTPEDFASVKIGGKIL